MKEKNNNQGNLEPENTTSTLTEKDNLSDTNSTDSKPSSPTYSKGETSLSSDELDQVVNMYLGEE